jgi:hypothetical protein
VIKEPQYKGRQGSDMGCSVVQKKVVYLSHVHPEGPATRHFDKGFHGFPAFNQMLRWFPSSKLLLHTSHVQLLHSNCKLINFSGGG